MNLNITKFEKLPRLAWLAEVKKHNKTINVFSGEWVDGRDRFFIEGAWDGEFEKGEFDKSVAFTGSGAILGQKEIKFVTPTNGMEAIYAIKFKDAYYFSNSISFLLEHLNLDLNYNYIDYESDFISIAEGILEYKKYIPLADNYKLEVYYFTNIIINENLELKLEDKLPSPEFRNFTDYHQYLLNTLKQMNKNFNAQNRVKKFDPLVFVSNGYDSPTCAVLGKSIGCDKAIVFESKKSKIDTGKPIAEKLGYKQIIEHDELEYLNTDRTEEFVANGEIGTSIYFSVVEKELEGSFVLSGGHGDLIWGKDTTPNTELIRDFFPGTARKEHRLRVGYQFLPVPFLAVQSHFSINRISNSEEMEKWTLNNDYDRPIARRIVETAGVPREMFGIEKDGGVASSLRFLNLMYLKKVMPKANFSEFKVFYKNNKNKRKKNLKYYYRSYRYIIYILKIVLKSKGIIKDFKLPEKKYTCSPWAPSFLFYWGVSKIRPRYNIKNL